MTKLLLAGSLVCSMTAFSQTTLFSDDFEAGGGNWTLNGGSGNNQWIVNNTYVGDDFGIIGDTPDQPAGVTGGPESYYLHVYNTDICGFANGCNANFDTGSASDQKAQMSNNVVTTGYSNVTLSFWYLCAGGSASYGSVEYSTDGTTWTSTGTNYMNTSTWTQATATLPAWANQAALKFRFRWQNGSTGNDPAFSVDEVTVTGTSGSFASVATGTINPMSWCFGTSASVSVSFSATGTVNAGNVYTAQLSDALGSFASPTAVGTLSSASTGMQTINATIPAGTPAGNGYRIRVTASDPATTGTDNGADLTIHALPTITIIGNPANGMICQGSSETMLASGGVSYVWTPATNLSSSTQAQTIATPPATATYTVTGTDVNGCVNTAPFTVTVQSCAGISENGATLLSLYPNPASEVVYLQYDASVAVQSVQLLDNSGRLIATLAANATEINTSSLATGSYIVRITHADGASIARFTKQ